MKRLIALLMASTLFLTACNSGMKNEDSNKNDSKIVEDVTSIDDIDLDINPETFSDLSDENLLQYVEDEVYAGITEQLASEDYIVESVDAIYISKEYLEEVEYNSQENIYFGYTLSELDAQYDGTRYVFTLGDDGQTTTKTFEKYDAFTVGEVFNDKESEIAEYIGKNGHFSSKFDFGPELCGKKADWMDHEKVTAEMYKEAIFESQARTGSIGFLSNIIENHDEPRGVSRFIPAEDLCDTSKKALACAYFFLRGIPFIYQGQEIGMENCRFDSIDEYDDISTKEEYRVCLEMGCDEKKALELAYTFSRDNARTPVQWTDGPNAGFTTGTPWIKVNPDYKRINLESQRDNKDSVYNFYKKMISIYKEPKYHEILTFGEFIPYKRNQKNLISYFRQAENKKILVMVNFQKQPQCVEIPGMTGQIILDNTDRSMTDMIKAAGIDGNRKNGINIELAGYEALVIELI